MVKPSDFYGFPYLAEIPLIFAGDGNKRSSIGSENIQVRNQQVMLDFDLANLYHVETRGLKQAVRRNPARFPPDFRFELTRSEWQELITIGDNLSLNVKFSPAMPYAFTEAGVAMLSSVLNSEQAILVNIEIIRVFTRLRQYLYENTTVRLEIEEIKLKGHGQQKKTPNLHPGNE